MVRLGIAHHYGWAVAVTASADHRVVDRRRVELIELGLPAAPVHHEGGPHFPSEAADVQDVSQDGIPATYRHLRSSS